MKKSKHKKIVKHAVQAAIQSTVETIQAQMEAERPVVTVLPLKGVIASSMDEGGGGAGLINADRLRKAIRKAFAPDNLVAVALDINSPGGSPAQSDIVAKMIKQAAAERDVPVLSFVQDVAASGGYWLACAGDEIYAQSNTSSVGSIGVVMEYMAYKGLMDKLGLEHRSFTAGENKRRSGPYTAMKASDAKHEKQELAELHTMFKDWVAASRGDRLNSADPDKDIFTGDTWFAAQAQELGLIDGIGMIDEVVAEKFGANVKIERVRVGKKAVDLMQLFGGEASAGNPAALVQAAMTALPGVMRQQAMWAPYNGLR